MIIVNEKKARELRMNNCVKIEAATLHSGFDVDELSESVSESCIAELYEADGIGPEGLSCVELHDASAIGKITYYEYLGLCVPGEGAPLSRRVIPGLGGKVPVNTSGGHCADPVLPYQ